MDRMAEEWKLVDAVWDYDEWGYPPSRTRLCDAVVFKLLVKKIPTRCSEQWPFDFDSRGQMRFEREPRGPTVWIEFGGRYYYPEIGGRYVLGGEIARTTGSWYIEPLHGVRRDVIYFGRVEVPSWAKDQGAIIISSRSVPGLTFDDDKRVSWEGRLGFPIIWAKKVDLEDPTSLTRATVRTRVKTESGQDANLVDYGPDEEPEDTQVSTEGLHRPRTLKRKPEAPVNTHRKRGKAEIIDLTIENIPIKSEVVSESQELHLENRTAAEPLITTPQQQSSAHNNTPRMLKRGGESRVVTRSQQTRQNHVNCLNSRRQD
ncbi:hypothetical protein CNMCM5793_009092 [Aspergillus hiratsukae]|uniref:Uncharacterized protein n=1 Tax=Aspergillus hiratsukae TaxID=1194566 RepID=A0A8H6PXV6_9EURO|nr:hypothetical protein CNMCM5793_009092 [Aspergillus hiratsukae]KAF7163215.1 hypothetical protein CNMCM6106_000203 [Aspergillus hiratsukae]